MENVTTLGQFVIEKQQDFPFAKGELSRLLRDIGIASKIISREVNKAGLTNILGDHGSVNVQEEDVKKLDIIGNETFISTFSKGGEVCVIASEENEGIIPLKGTFSKNGKYVICMDPLDGSSNIDVNVSIGTSTLTIRSHSGTLCKVVGFTYSSFSRKIALMFLFDSMGIGYANVVLTVTTLVISFFCCCCCCC